MAPGSPLRPGTWAAANDSTSGTDWLSRVVMSLARASPAPACPVPTASTWPAILASRVARLLSLFRLSASHDTPLYRAVTALPTPRVANATVTSATTRRAAARKGGGNGRELSKSSGRYGTHTDGSYAVGTLAISDRRNSLSYIAANYPEPELLNSYRY